MTGFEAPHIEYFSVSPILIVLGVAVTRERAAHRALRDGMRLRVADRPAVG